MDWVAYWQGQCGCLSPSTKLLHNAVDHGTSPSSNSAPVSNMQNFDRYTYEVDNQPEENV